MRSLRFHGPRDLRLEDVPAPAVHDGTVEIDVAWCGICASDVHEYRDGPHIIPTPDRPHPLTGDHLPVTLGHEISGRVSRIGRGVSGLEVGAPVVVNPLLCCERCTPCRQGLRHLCRRSAVVGLSGGGGGLAERVVVPAGNLHELPAAAGLRTGALVEPLTVAWHAARLASDPPPTTALVVGVGPVGLAVVLVLRALGVPQIVVAARREGLRTRLARDLGAHAIIGAEEPLPGRTVRRLTAGEGVDVAFEAAGTDDALSVAVSAVRRRGTVVNLALRPTRAGLDLNRVLAHEIVLRGSTGYLDDHPEVLRHLAAGAFDGVDRLVTGQITLDDAVVDGFEPLLHHRADHVKVLVSPDQVPVAAAHGPPAPLSSQ